MRYVALLHQEPEANEIEVCFPDLPGCVTAGPTLAEARQLAGEALRHIWARQGCRCLSHQSSLRCSIIPIMPTAWR
jgi:HicB-like antitoxin of HicAB toxin-antitoxin system